MVRMLSMSWIYESSDEISESAISVGRSLVGNRSFPDKLFSIYIVKF